MRLGGRSSVRNRLVLLFFAITAAAMGFVYLYVVPQLSTSLTAERLASLEREGPGSGEALARLAGTGADLSVIRQRLNRIEAAVDARATLLGVRDGVPSFVIADSDFEPDAVEADYPAARSSITTGEVRSAVATARGQRTGETAIPVLAPDERGPSWVLVLSVPLDDVADNVDLIRRQILIAAAIALTAALIAAWVAAGAHARRLRRLEHAAERVAEGDFEVPIPVDRDDEVGQLAASFDEMQAELATLDEARREFIANASHELRTPITSLGGFLELLDEEEEPDREARREFNRVMRAQIERLQRLTESLLDLSKLDAEAIELEREALRLGELCEAVAAEFAPRLAGSATGLSLAIDDAAARLVQADRGRTLQVLRILIDNAIKHTPEGTRITIETGATEDRGLIRVVDDGPGIPPAARERIFERFFTADSVGGSGLGLSIARQLCRRMGGDLRLLDAGRARTAFELSLPLAGAGA